MCCSWDLARLDHTLAQICKAHWTQAYSSVWSGTCKRQGPGAAKAKAKARVRASYAVGQPMILTMSSPRAQLLVFQSVVIPMERQVLPVPVLTPPVKA